MAAQETLPGTSLTFNPMDHGLWKRFVDSDGQINHAQWMRARAENQWVGTCRRCGDYLKPQRPEQVNDTRTDYEAHCRQDRCGWTCNAPNGRYFARSSRRSEMPNGYWENRDSSQGTEGSSRGKK